MFHMETGRFTLLTLGSAVASLMLIVLSACAGAQEPAPLGEALTLSYDTQTWVNAISGTPVITGTVECPAVAQGVTISLDLEQDKSGSYAYDATTFECDEAQMRWMVAFNEENFEAGPAALNGTASYELETTDAERNDTTTLVACTRIGTMEDDEFVGTQKKDRICGLDGDDEFNGRGGNDTLRGGDGDDFAKGSDGDDVLFGGYGEDDLVGGTGDDKLSGNQQNDYLNGSKGDDDCDGGGGAKDKLVSC